MHLINRYVVIIKAKPAILDWLNQMPDDQPLAWDEVNRECTAILIPDFEDDDDAQAYLEELKPTLLEMELAAWIVDERLWPAKRDIALFDEWFEFEIHSMVWDADNSVIIKEIV